MTEEGVCPDLATHLIVGGAWSLGRPRPRPLGSGAVLAVWSCCYLALTCQGSEHRLTEVPWDPALELAVLEDRKLTCRKDDRRAGNTVRLIVQVRSAITAVVVYPYVERERKANRPVLCISP